MIAAQEPDPRHGRELRLRLGARARAVGAAGLRLPGDRRVLVRGHLLLELHEDRPAAGRAARGRGQGADGGGRGRGRPGGARRALRGPRRAVRARRRPPPPAAERARRHRAHACRSPRTSPRTSPRASVLVPSPESVGSRNSCRTLPFSLVTELVRSRRRPPVEVLNAVADRPHLRRAQGRRCRHRRVRRRHDRRDDGGLSSASDAVLLGAVGGPKWDTNETGAVRAEDALFGLRAGLGLYANLRPIRPLPALYDASPLKRELIEGVDMLIVRELTGGLYYGERGDRATAARTTRWSTPSRRSSGSRAARLPRRQVARDVGRQGQRAGHRRACGVRSPRGSTPRSSRTSSSSTSSSTPPR